MLSVPRLFAILLILLVSAGLPTELLASAHSVSGNGGQATGAREMGAPITAVLLFIVPLAIGIIALHFGLAWASVAGAEFERADHCEQCCFSDGRGACSSKLWRWYPLRRVVTSSPRLGSLCPFCFERAKTHVGKANRKTLKNYFVALGCFLIAAIPAFWGGMWVAAKTLSSIIGG